MAPPTSKVIYKVLSSEQWADAEKQGKFLGAAVDLEDGYIHFSTAAQVEETVAKHFAGQSDLILLGVAPEKLDDLRWEPSRGGDLFPHLYGVLSLDAVCSVSELPLGKNGQHIFPNDLVYD